MNNQHLKKRISQNWGRFSRLSLDVEIDWPVMIFVSTWIAILLVAWGVWNYMNISEKIEKRGVTDAKARSVTLDENILQSVLREYDDRAKETVDLQGGYSGLRDPSL